MVFKMAKKHRSPAYPGLTISEAINRVRQFYDKEKTHASPVKVAVTHWGYGEKSSGGLMVISALKSYGLMNDAGSGESRVVSLTKDALNYVYDTREHSDERDNILADAVMKPKILRDLIVGYPDTHVSDGTLDFYLKQRGYNPNAVSDIIKVYRDALNYVDKSIDDSVIDTSESQLGVSNYATSSESINIHKPPNDLDQIAISNPKMIQDTFNLEEGKVILQIPSTMTIESFEDFTDWLLIQHRKIARTVEGDDKPKLQVKD